MKISMTVPGEKLLIRLWDTLADKSIGTLLRPWQIRREGLAKLDVRRAEILTIAQTEIDAQEIRNGNITLEDLGINFKTARKKLISSEIARIEPNFEEQNLIQTIEKNRIRDAVRKEINIANAIAIAEETLKEDTQEPPIEAIEDDWLYCWRDYAANFSDAKLQEIWGKALAGELKTPGSYSIRCLEFLKNLSQEEANTIEKLSAFTVENSIWRGKLELLEEKGLSFDILLDMQELGIISGVNSAGLHLKWPSPINPNFYVTLVSNGKVLIVKHEDPNKLPYIKTFKITSIGQQVFSLGKFEPNMEYLEALGKSLKDQGFNVTIADVKKISKDNLTYGNENDLSK